MNVPPVVLYLGIALLGLGAWGSVVGILRYFRRDDAQARPFDEVLGQVRWGWFEVIYAICAYLLFQGMASILVHSGLQAAHQWRLESMLPRTRAAIEELVERGAFPAPSPELVTVGFLAHILSGAVFLLFVIFLIAQRTGGSLDSIGLRAWPTRRTALRLLGLFVCFIIPCVVIRVGWVAGLEKLGFEALEQTPVQMFRDVIQGRNWTGMIAIAVGAVAVAPVIEEVLFRGILHTFLVHRLRRVSAAVLISSALFAAIHINLGAILPIFVLGCLLALIYQRRGSVYDAILFHALFNFISLTVLALSVFLAL